MFKYLSMNHKIITAYCLIFFGFALPCLSQQNSLPRHAGNPKVQNAAAFSNGLKCKYREDIQGAITNFEKALTAMPDDAASMYELSALYVDAGRMEEAFSMIQNAASLDPENKWYQVRLGKFYRNLEMYDDFVKLYEKLTAKYPDDLDMLSELIDALLLKEDYDKALVKLDDFERQVGSNEIISEQKIAIFQQQGNEKAQIRELQKLIENDPANPRYYNMLAQIYVKAGRENEAMKMFEKVEELNPNDPYINVSLMEFYDNKGDKAKAFEEFIAAIRNKNLDMNTKTSIYEYWFKNAQGDETDEQALQVGNAFVETYPDNKVGYIVLGSYYINKKDLDRSKAMYLKALSLDSTDYMAWQNLVLVEADQKDDAAVLKHAKQALRYYPMQPIFYWYAGVGSYLAEQNEEAIAYLEKGRKYCTDLSLQTTFDSYLGDLYHQKGEEKKAFEAYDRVLRTDPDNALVLNNYAYYLSLKGVELDKAKEMSSHAVELEPKNATYLDTYAWVLYKRGEYKEAQQQMKKALNLVSDPEGLYYEHYGDILFRLGNKKDAIEYWNKAAQKGDGSEFLERKLKNGELYE